jgi:hypothetical protein
MLERGDTPPRFFGEDFVGVFGSAGELEVVVLAFFVVGVEGSISIVGSFVLFFNGDTESFLLPSFFWGVSPVLGFLITFLGDA